MKNLLNFCFLLEISLQTYHHYYRYGAREIGNSGEWNQVVYIDVYEEKYFKWYLVSPKKLFIW